MCIAQKVNEMNKTFYKLTNSLTPAPFNPETRTAAKNIAGLVKRMRADGFLWYRPILITKAGEIGDGHRRWHSAKTLGLETVPCLIIDDKTAEQIWASVNDETRTVTDRETLAAIAAGLKVIPPSKQAAVDKVKRIMGDEGIAILASAGLSPYTVDVSLRFVRACGRSGDDQFTLKTCLWMIKHRMQIATRYILRLGAGGDKLAAYVENDIPLLGEW